MLDESEQKVEMAERNLTNTRRARSTSIQREIVKVVRM